MELVVIDTSSSSLEPPYYTELQTFYSHLSSLQAASSASSVQ